MSDVSSDSQAGRGITTASFFSNLIPGLFGVAGVGLMAYVALMANKFSINASINFLRAKFAFQLDAEEGGGE